MKIILNLTVVMIIVLITSACGDKTPPKIVKELKTPDIMVIGTQTWTAINLNVATFRNGEAIPEAKTDEEWKAAGKNKRPAWCYYGNDPKNGEKYGKLYNRIAINDSRKLAPAGWHVATAYEWNHLTVYLGGDSIAGKKMKSKFEWGKNDKGNNSSGFGGLPSGYRFNDGTFSPVGYNCFWWCASDVNVPYNYYWYLYYNYSPLYLYYTLENPGFSVRCVKDSVLAHL